MITRHTHGDLVWIDAVHPSADEVRSLMEEYKLDPLIAHEITAPSVRNRVDTRDGYFYLVLHFPAFQQQHDIANYAVELDFIVGRDWIITTRYDDVDPLHHFSTIFEVDTMLDKKNMGAHAGFVFYYMLSELYGSFINELANTHLRLDAAEDRIFEGYEKEMVEELSYISRDLLNYTQALDGHDGILRSLERPAAALFDYTYIRHLRSVVGEYERLAHEVRIARESLLELRETNNSLLTTKQNEIMKIFTIMAFVTFPLTLFSSIFGMNTSFVPIVGHPNDFWIILGCMFAAALSFFAYFKYKKWL